MPVVAQPSARRRTYYVTVSGVAPAAKDIDVVVGTGMTITPVTVGERTTVTLSSTGAPSTVDYLVRTASGSLSAERVVTDTATVTWDWSTAGQAKANATATIADGDYGDIVVSGSGTVWTLDTVTVAKGGTGSTTAADARTALGLAIDSDVQAYSAYLAGLAGASQSITADTTLTTQRAHLISDGSWAITLPTVASWTIGVPTLITYDGTTEATIEIVPNAADKVNGSTRAALVGTRIVATLTPVAANKFTLTVQSGRLLWLHILLDPTTATGAGPYTVGSTTWTDISTASSSVTSVSGFLFNSKSGSAYTGGASADCALIRSPCSGLVDSWSRPFDPTTQRAWLMVKGSKTTTVGGSTPAWILGIGGSTVSVVPRIAADISGAAGIAQYIARDSAARSIDLTEAAFTSAGWLGFCWDPAALQFVDGICSTSPSGSPGSSGGFWPTSYRNAERIKVGQDYFGSVWRVGNLTDVHIAQTTPTTGSKYTATEFAILIEEVAP